MRYLNQEIHLMAQQHSSLAPLGEGALPFIQLDDFVNTWPLSRHDQFSLQDKNFTLRVPTHQVPISPRHSQKSTVDQQNTSMFHWVPGSAQYLVIDLAVTIFPGTYLPRRNGFCCLSHGVRISVPGGMCTNTLEGVRELFSDTMVCLTRFCRRGLGVWRSG